MHATQQLGEEHDKSSRITSSNGTTSTPEQQSPLRFQQGEARPAPKALWADPANVKAAHAALTAFLQKSGLSQYLSIEPTEVRTASCPSGTNQQMVHCCVAATCLHGSVHVVLC